MAGSYSNDELLRSAIASSRNNLTQADEEWLAQLLNNRPAQLGSMPLYGLSAVPNISAESVDYGTVQSPLAGRRDALVSSAQNSSRMAVAQDREETIATLRRLRPDIAEKLGLSEYSPPQFEAQAPSLPPLRPRVAPSQPQAQTARQSPAAPPLGEVPWERVAPQIASGVGTPDYGGGASDGNYDPNQPMVGGGITGRAPSGYGIGDMVHSVMGSVFGINTQPRPREIPAYGLPMPAEIYGGGAGPFENAQTPVAQPVATAGAPPAQQTNQPVPYPREDPLARFERIARLMQLGETVGSAFDKGDYQVISPGGGVAQPQLPQNAQYGLRI